MYGKDRPDFEMNLSKNVFDGQFRGMRSSTKLTTSLSRRSLGLMIGITLEISPGVLFFGLFNRIGPIRTQAKMINRGSTYNSFTTVIVEGCCNQSTRGQFCNQTVEQLSCHQSLLYKLGQSLELIKMHNDVGTRLFTCNKYLKRSCHQDLDPKTYSLDVTQPVEEVVILASDFRSSGAQFTDNSGINLMCYVRYGAIPENRLYDYAVDLSQMSLRIPLPKIGTWYFNIQPVDNSNVLEAREQKTVDLCYSMEWKVSECPHGKAGPNCTWERYMLQVDQRDDSDAFFVYMPKLVNMPVELHNLPLEPLLSNTSSDNESDMAWTYFVFDVPRGASGKNIHTDLNANSNINYELYIRFGGLPSIRDWDYFYINQTSNSDNGSSKFKLYDLSERRVNAYLPQPREGLWSFGLRHPVLSKTCCRTTLSVSVENCPNQCSDHGTCILNDGKLGPSFYSYYSCKCDARYGGFDCSTQLVSQSAQRWHVVFLTGSNAAALLPEVWALHQKAFAEWWSSAAVGLLVQYIMPVMSVAGVFFHFMSSRSRNIPLVLALGAFSLHFAWLMELFSAYRSNSLSLRSSWNIQHRWLNVRPWFPDVLKALNKRFKWLFVVHCIVNGCIKLESGKRRDLMDLA
ncbi:hypothetical protein ACH5RR_041612 [Cinchona calisaya]|uniref:EGF-like domain-containing protein n=1 Tax=Cinchona calisaya TaxID=153742 RepID=A0ABD2XZF7_9GENT